MSQILVTDELVSNTLTNLATLPPLFKIILSHISLDAPYEVIGLAALQVDPNIDRPEKNKPIQTIVERQIQLAAVKFVDEIVMYSTETELEDLFLTLPLDVRVLGDEYRNKEFTAKQICLDRKIKIVYNKRDHTFSSTSLRNRIGVYNEKQDNSNS